MDNPEAGKTITATVTHGGNIDLTYGDMGVTVGEEFPEFLFNDIAENVAYLAHVVDTNGEPVYPEPEPERTAWDEIRDVIRVIEDNPEIFDKTGVDLSIDFSYGEPNIDFNLYGAMEASVFDQLQEILPPSEWETSSGGSYTTIVGHVGELRVRLYTNRENVCTRVQVGTETKVEMVPPSGVELVEKRTEVPVYSWDC